MSNLPTIQDLHESNSIASYKNDQLNLLLNQEPKKEWVKDHPLCQRTQVYPNRQSGVHA